ncbi:Tannase/feruloyl esterase [Xylogone sp. PMI_703]|nr:Tannase/feruloyl esterase [Xylogone sp. PMI_703]
MPLGARSLLLGSGLLRLQTPNTPQYEYEYPAVNNCSSSFLTPGIEIPNRAQLLNVDANAVIDATVPGSSVNISYCNVTVTYSHPGYDDTIHITVYLPLDKWNGRFQGVGGGGWAMNSGHRSLLVPVASGFSAGNTDGGHDPHAGSTASWWRNAQGNLNIPLLIDYASVALNDLAVVGKQLSNRFYGYGPAYSYWNGCSTGGRQGLMLAQRYPTAYDGISAAAPAINGPRFTVAAYWGQFVMDQLNHYPPQCVFDTFNAAVVAACDDLDGVTDGVISALSLCKFDPETIVGRKANCNNDQMTITSTDAKIVREIWRGPRTSDNSFVWYGINPGTPFSGLSATSCTGIANCTGIPFPISVDWMTRWVLVNPDFDLTTLTLDTFVQIFNISQMLYQNILGTDNPDLSEFKRAGGKMITWHGLADQIIFPGGTEDYYQRVEALDPDVRDYYRFYYAPGVQHCWGGAGEHPVNPLNAVINWVENGQAPDTLAAASLDGRRTRDLCQYPLVSVYKGGDKTKASSFACEPNF